jgi:hypothetical protein
MLLTHRYRGQARSHRECGLPKISSAGSFLLPFIEPAEHYQQT